MAKIVSESITATVSRIARQDQELSPAITDEVIHTLEQVLQELVGDSAVVEVTENSE